MTSVSKNGTSTGKGERKRKGAESRRGEKE